ncbi:hypothetical protein P22_0719 [Propionispora sp. 2/2-37]|uniref:MotA/TolQ/ExbB proton channel family protein n=1 Tax=Propionispora sp. 2/2-37 TaxID=1677858 RepID=UPI0006BB98C4|nr:MotA/TolQ/ExbB proton channel family protein [Propionispora sp. 2/2-37]CUH94653.1 hypothetical protein P22_0719 [Propionispora sp. 2/2-37]
MNAILEGMELFHKGGPVMYLLLCCSLLVISIGVERYIYYRGAKTEMAGFIDPLSAFLAQGEWEKAAGFCRQRGGVAARLAEKGLQCRQNGSRYMESVLEGEAALTVGKLRQNLRHLDTIVTVAPLLGLLGTVIGMIGSFSVFNLKAGQPMAITGGVGEALIATATGLCVATLSMLVYSYFNHRLDGIITDMEQVCLLVLTCHRRENHHETA